jgi:septum formation protein
MNPIRLCLASASPRRRELLQQAGFDPLVRPAGIPEDRRTGEAPSEHVLRLARAKARAVLERLDRDAGPCVVLAADTAVVLDGDPMGKPTSHEEACKMLRRLSDRTHEVLTGVHIARTDDPRSAGCLEATCVRFRAYPDSLIRWYVDTGEPLDKAGAYAIQGRGALLARRVEGSWTNVVGLPVERLPGLLREVGVRPADLLP